VLAQHTLHGGSTGYALLLTGWGAGTILGSAAYTLGRRVATWRMLAFGAGLLAVGYLAMGLAPTLAAAIPGAVLGGMGNGIDSVSSRTNLQEAVRPHWMTVVTALNESMWQALPGAGVLIGGAVAALAGARAAMMLAVGGAALIVLLSWRLLRLSDRTAEDPLVHSLEELPGQPSPPPSPSPPTATRAL
jgi:MFS family permease